MNSTKYKPSMFNRIVDSGVQCALYNSAKGTSSITLVSDESVERIKSMFASTYIEVDDISNDPVLKVLVERGYIVPFSSDEKAYRENLCLNRVMDKTLHLVIHITKACNFRCAYCYMDFEPEYLSVEAQLGIVEFVKRNIKNYKGLVIDWFGGEPLMDVDIIDNLSQQLINICKINRKPYAAHITSNGYLLTPDIFVRLLAARVIAYTITIDGTRELHNSKRVLSDGSPTFDRIIENLIHIKDNVHTSNLQVVIRSNLTMQHIPSIREYYDYFDDMFGGDKRFALFVRPVADYGGDRVKELSDIFIKEFGDIYSTLSLFEGKIGFHANYLDLEPGGFSCHAKCANKFSVSVDGSLHKCDEYLENSIGKIDKLGKMSIDTREHVKWISMRPTTSNCDNCFFSCCCMMEHCPKQRVSSGSTHCQIEFSEIDSEILFYATLNRVQVI